MIWEKTHYFWKHPYNWVGCHPLYNPTNPGFLYICLSRQLVGQGGHQRLVGPMDLRPFFVGNKRVGCYLKHEGYIQIFQIHVLTFESFKLVVKILVCPTRLRYATLLIWVQPSQAPQKRTDHFWPPQHVVIWVDCSISFSKWEIFIKYPPGKYHLLPSQAALLRWWWGGICYSSSLEDMFQCSSHFGEKGGKVVAVLSSF